MADNQLPENQVGVVLLAGVIGELMEELVKSRAIEKESMLKRLDNIESLMEAEFPKAKMTPAVMSLFRRQVRGDE